MQQRADRVKFPGGALKPYDDRVPIETRIEREPLEHDLGLAVEMARTFWRGDRGLSEIRLQRAGMPAARPPRGQILSEVPPPYFVLTSSWPVQRGLARTTDVSSCRSGILQ